MVNEFSRNVKKLLFLLTGRGTAEFSSAEYWDERYRRNGTSGAGSYKHLAAFKADVLNSFVKERTIQSVVEFGCGDGNQLNLAEYPHYIGFDVSPKSIELCRQAFAGHPNKLFYLSSDGVQAKGDLALSLDVIYHLVEDEVFHRYMELLFQSSSRWVIVYSSNTDMNDTAQSIHVRHRKFTDWIDRHASNFEMIRHIPNMYPVDRYGADGSFADFFIFQKRD